MKNVDGSESQRTMKLKTPHRETHCICAPLPPNRLTA